MSSHSNQADQHIPRLGEAFREDFDIGAAVNPMTIQTQRDLLAAHYNSITAENEMKFERIHPEEDQYTFEEADALVHFASEHGMKMRGHTLVWHNQTPPWVFTGPDGQPADRDLLLARLKAHTDTVVGRYKGKIYAWDVVNEVIEDKSDIWLRDTSWLRQIGEDYIAQAFRYTHEADPNALLFYNDYNESHPEKREKIVRLLRSLKEQDVPIHGMGMQAHWNLYGPSLDDIRAAIEAYAALGLIIHVTELDMSVFAFEDRRTDLLQPPQDLLQLQAERYEQVFDLFREYKDVVQSVTFWGAADDYTWLDDFPVRGRKNWPFVFDTEHQPKASFWNLLKR